MTPRYYSYNYTSIVPIKDMYLSYIASLSEIYSQSNCFKLFEIFVIQNQQIYSKSEVLYKTLIIKLFVKHVFFMRNVLL